MRHGLTSRDLAFCGLFGAAALLLPVLFHVVQLGHVFMPMYLPLVALAFFTRPLPAAVTAFITPILSGGVTGMPPFFPPIALFMSIELSLMCGIIAAVYGRWPGLNTYFVLVPALLLGRGFYLGLVYLFALFIDLPPAFMAGLSFISGWPGIILMLVAIPVIVKSGRSHVKGSSRFQKGKIHES